jgi:uroporphyrinogen decarboxylase
MTSRELVIRTLNHEPVDRVPRDLWPSPGVEMCRGEELAEVNLRYPSDIVPPDFKYAPGNRSQGKPHHAGCYTDAWGCTWEMTSQGAVCAKEAPLAHASSIAAYQPPRELLDSSRFTNVNRGCETTSRFVLARSDVRPFERLQTLRGAEAALLDVAHGTKPIRHLLAMLHDFYCREIELWANTEVDGVAFHDVWGSADALLLAPELWCELFKPLYREYCQILHGKDKFVFFHSGGNIADIFGDLVKIGVDAIHSQWMHMPLDRLAERFRGQVTFWGGIGDPQIFAQGKPQEIRDAVQQVRRALDFGAGGVIAHCCWEPDVTLRNVISVFEQWLVPMPMHV